MKLKFYSTKSFNRFAPSQNKPGGIGNLIFKSSFVFGLAFATIQSSAHTSLHKPASQSFTTFFYHDITGLNTLATDPTVPTIAYLGVSASYATGVTITPVNPTVTGSLTGNGSYGETPILLSSGFSYPEGVTVDHLGMVYVADAGDHTVKKINPVTGEVTPVGSGFYYPSGVAVDVAGNVFVVDNNNGIKKVPIDGGIITTIAPSLNKPLDLALDKTGNILIADYWGNTVYKVTMPGGQLSILGSGFFGPNYLAVNSTGDIYVSDLKNGAIKKIIASSNEVVTVAPSPGHCYGIAVDGFNNIYVADAANGPIYKIAAGSEVATDMGFAFNQPYGLAIDSVGNLFVSDAGDNTLSKIPANIFSVSPALPAGLTLDPVTGILSGTPTEVTPMTTYTVSAQNLGKVVSTTFSFSTNSALDVHWIHLSGQLNSLQNAVLSWQVAEHHVARYEIEMSEDGHAFRNVGTIASKGNGINSYSFLDPHIYVGRAVYRIAQIDLDGSWSYSPVISLPSNRTPAIQVFPNPVKNQMTLTVTDGLVGSNALLYTLDGRCVRRIRLVTPDTKVLLQGLADGIYFLRFKDGSSKKIYIQGK